MNALAAVSRCLWRFWRPQRGQRAGWQQWRRWGGHPHLHYQAALGGQGLPHRSARGLRLRPPLRQQSDDAIPAIYAWYDFHLKGISSATYTNTPRVCIAIGDTPTNNAASVDAGVTLTDVPVGSLTGTGALPPVLATATAAVNPTHAEPNPLFLPVVSVTEADFVLVGIPSVDVIQVADGTPPSPTTAVAYVGGGIRRTVNGMPRTILVDQEITPFAKGTHNNNHNINQTDNTSVLLPGVGEKLLPGDQVGLVLYCANIHYQSVGSTAAASGVGGAGPSAPSQFPGATIPNATTCTNNYSVQFTNIQLPIFKPGVFPRLGTDALAPPSAQKNRPRPFFFGRAQANTAMTARCGCPLPPRPRGELARQKRGSR